MKKLLTILTFITLQCASQTTVFKINNPINNKDIKVTDIDLHYHSGVLISGFATSSFYYFIDRPLIATFVGALVGTAAGVVKEKVWDGAMHKGTDSMNDMVYTSAGSLVVMVHFNIYVNSARVRKPKTIKTNLL